MPRVSVIMGIYNCEETLERSIESVINQTYSDWELIMCDDASTDRTLQIAEDYAKKYCDRIMVLKNKRNRKLAYSLNRCLDVARGEYIARLDADDYNLPTRYEKQVMFLDLHPEYAVVSCQSIVFDENGDRGIRCHEGEPRPTDIFFSTPFQHPTIMMRKSAYEKLGGYTVSKRTEIAQDADLWFRFTAAGFKGYTLGEPLYKYHESLDDYRRRSWKKALYRSQTRFIGYKLIKAPIWCYVLVLKPLLAVLIPSPLLYQRRNRIERNKQL